MTLDRRGFLGLVGAGAASPALAQAGQAPAVQFLHGVASGDPSASRVILWTRVTPPAGWTQAITVSLVVRERGAEYAPDLHDLEATADRDWTVKFDKGGLQPGTEYEFFFEAGSVQSPVGRTKTLPVGDTPDVVLAVASCALHPGGLFNAYDAIGRLERVDAVVHLGDYIYEYGAEPDAYGNKIGAPLGRVPVPGHEIVSLADYRQRHAQYKADPDLQAAHARAPFICVWDDHELANDGYLSGAQNHQPDTEGDFVARKAAALRAYYEWMPIREPAAGTLIEAIQRSFHFGALASLHMVETRLQARQKPLSYGTDIPMTTGRRPQPDVAAFRARLDDPSRELLGAEQRAWLGRALAESRDEGRAWQVLGNQVVMARVAGPDIEKLATPLERAVLFSRLPPDIRRQVQQAIPLFRAGLPYNLDSWDGYPAERERVYALFKEAGVQPIVLAGDSHSFWVNELKDASGERRAVEFGTTSITSPSPEDAVGGKFPLGAALNATNPEVIFCDQSSKGFTLLTFTPEAVTADLMKVSTITAKPYDLTRVKRFRVTREGERLGAVAEA